MKRLVRLHAFPIVVSLILVSCQCRTTECYDAAVRRPNIVILYADDMGWGDLAIQNPDSKIPTPHLDQLAREGTRFTDAHSSSGICSPSRYALLHGRYHWRKFHGIVNSFGPSVMDADRLTIAEVLKASDRAHVPRLITLSFKPLEPTVRYCIMKHRSL